MWLDECVCIYVYILLLSYLFQIRAKRPSFSILQKEFKVCIDERIGSRQERFASKTSTLENSCVHRYHKDVRVLKDAFYDRRDMRQYTYRTL